MEKYRILFVFLLFACAGFCRQSCPAEVNNNTPYTIQYSEIQMLKTAASLIVGDKPFQNRRILSDKLNIFIKNALPSLQMVIRLAPPLFIFTFFSALLAGWLRMNKKWHTAYTRKVFHFLIFTLAGFLQMSLGLSAVVLFGMIAGFTVLFAVYRGAGFPFYEAMARPADAPHRTLFILIPLLTTALGGITTSLFFQPFAPIGYLVSGWGDAVGEPVGARWGKHPYRVPSLGGVTATRTIEGSLAVLLLSFLAALTGLLLIDIPFYNAVYLGAVCAVMSTGVESISTHGLDNFTIQVTAAGLISLLAG